MGMEERKEARGGRREGAGRKKVNPDVKRVQMVITISPETRDMLKEGAKEMGISPGKYLELLLLK